ncbi:uracil-DNA glycosylase family protein [Pseudohaliea sp.]|uniref:uracil-DNA glycosylase family protein n=1 Tax=Pseudohaliea sp. TaxID=2740289 RepID=UPI0032ED80E2
MSEEPLDHLLARVRACRLCEASLPLGPRPVVQASASARILVVGQAPGRRVHASGLPFDDPSGDRLRDWMGIDRAVFYNELLVAAVPMGFCYPGTGPGGDLPPLPECAEAWREALLAKLRGIRLTLVIGQYARRWHLPEARGSLTDTVRGWRQLGPGLLPLPHPSPRNNRWLRRNPWFEEEVVPELKRRVAAALAARGAVSPAGCAGESRSRT